MNYKKKQSCGVFLHKKKGWWAQLEISNGDKYYTMYFKDYKEAAQEYNRVIKKLKKKYGLRNMFKWGLPTKCIPTEMKSNLHEEKHLKKITRSGKYY